MLPDRIELSTSPLPMECSTTELRQHAGIQESAQKGLYRRPVLATRTPLAQARGRAGNGPKRPKIGAKPRPRQSGQPRADRLPIATASAWRGLEGANHGLACVHFAGGVERSVRGLAIAQRASQPHYVPITATLAGQRLRGDPVLITAYSTGPR